VSENEQTPSLSVALFCSLQMFSNGEGNFEVFLDSSANKKATKQQTFVYGIERSEVKIPQLFLGTQNHMKMTAIWSI
jgi:hypothetical protein